MAVLESSERIPSSFIKALVIAEDHRSEFHPGVDPIAIIRMLLARVKKNQPRGGASTIEQQYVRVVTSRYEQTVSRKFREQMLAIMISRRASKASIASAYLAIAFYGTGFVGISGLRDCFGEDLESATFYQALQMVVYLKYPRPRNPNEKWDNKISTRLRVISSRLESGCYNSLRPDLVSLRDV
ncbi:biosynthetic peptidoglycan transglycosylase [Halomonas getboli]|uniref:biosynthetic peptidoglycan transglycosylase n=1 Tax=Halomonas getboli TaxID=2935862 RepID=UPI001FFEAFA4|nr:biosynthetic peptidoglycan transglycosylase [Halomonas getboli]MCK2184102.1 transglycosylase domain-containing protein [Halomonas getboli]